MPNGYSRGVTRRRGDARRRSKSAAQRQEAKDKASKKDKLEVSCVSGGSGPAGQGACMQSNYG